MSGTGKWWEMFILNCHEQLRFHKVLRSTENMAEHGDKLDKLEDHWVPQEWVNVLRIESLAYSVLKDTDIPHLSPSPLPPPHPAPSRHRDNHRKEGVGKIVGQRWEITIKETVFLDTAGKLPIRTHSN